MFIASAALGLGRFDKGSENRGGGGRGPFFLPTLQSRFTEDNGIVQNGTKRAVAVICFSFEASAEQAKTNFKMSAKRTQYTAKFKLEVVRFAEGENNCAASRRFSVSEACVRRWRKQKEALSGSNKQRKAFRGPARGRFPEIEEELTAFVNLLRSKANPVTAEILQIKARELARAKNVPHASFKASRGWIQRFMRRQNFSLRRRTTIAQRLPADYEDKLVKFQQHVIKLRQEKNYMFGQIGNADETPVYFDMPSASTIAAKGSKSVPIRSCGYEKSRVTVMLCITADGRKLPPYVILKRKTIPKEDFPKNVIVRAQENGWMTEDLTIDWLKTVWMRRPGALFKQPSMLVLDAFKGHTTEKVKAAIKEMGSDFVCIPGGMTSQLQPLDVSVNKPFKDNFKRLYNEWLCDEERDSALTPSGKVKRASCSQLCRWVAEAWDAVTPELIKKSFRKCCISNNLDGSEDDVLYESDAEEMDVSESSSSDDEV